MPDLPDIVGNTSQEVSSLTARMQSMASQVAAEPGTRVIQGVAPGAVRPKPPAVVTNVVDVSGKKFGKDLRAKIRVPTDYFTQVTSGSEDEIKNLKGIIFPYTPSISVEYKADYTSASPLHANFPINFYQRSTIGSISVTGKFTVENKKDAAVWIATVHLLKALTKMKSGGSTGDQDSGSPPPVCRFDAHGEWMFNNMPVAVTSFRLELPDGVDYFTMPTSSIYEVTSVPIVSTLSVTLLPMYSRAEMQVFNVTDYLSGSSGYSKKGF